MPPQIEAERQSARGDFLPALRWAALTPLFDAVVRITTRERAFKRRLVDLAGVAPGEAVLDLGSGTGTLAIWLKQRQAEADVVGLDADAQILARARRKAAQAGCDVKFAEGLSTALPFDDDAFDVVVSTLFFHHLTPAAKRGTLAEVRRVLKPSGRLLVADYGAPGNPLMAAQLLWIRVFDGFEVTRENARGLLPVLFREAGLARAEVRDELSTPLGTLAIYSALAPLAG